MCSSSDVAFRDTAASKPQPTPRSIIFTANLRAASTYRIIEQYQRLQRRVRGRSIHDALLTSGRIKGQQARVQEAALPEGVDAAAVEIRPMARRVFAFGKVQRRQVSIRLIRLSA